MRTSVLLVLSLALAVGLLVSSSAALAQDPPTVPSERKSDTRLWFGWGTEVESQDATGILNVNYVRSNHFFGIRYTGAVGANVWTGTELLGEVRSEVSLLYGRPVTWDWGHASLAGGIAVVWGEGLISESGSTTTIGIPLQAMLYVTPPYRPVDWLGFQIGWNANVNPERSFGGVTVGLVIGKLR